jgi:hypothetical protein
MVSYDELPRLRAELEAAAKQAEAEAALEGAAATPPDSCGSVPTASTVPAMMPERPHWQWKPGQSGNPRGRPKGSKNKNRALAEALLDSESLELARLALGFAAEGDKVMLRACLTRAVPPARGRTVRVRLQTGHKPWDIIAALHDAQDRMTAGIITPQEAREIAHFLTQRLAAYETWLRTRAAEKAAGIFWPDDEEDGEDEEEDEEDAVEGAEAASVGDRAAGD